MEVDGMALDDHVLNTKQVVFHSLHETHDQFQGV